MAIFGWEYYCQVISEDDEIRDVFLENQEKLAKEICLYAEMYGDAQDKMREQNFKKISKIALHLTSLEEN